MAGRVMDFEDFICETYDEIEGAIWDIADIYGIDLEPLDCHRTAGDIREDLTQKFHGCWPYYGDEEKPCYLGECDYRCEHCPMRWNYSYEFNPDSENERDMIVALIRAIKACQSYKPTDSEIETAIKIVKGE